MDNCSTVTSPSNAFLTNITYPTVNGIPHTNNYQYHCATGLLATAQDENSQITTYLYNTPPSGCATPDGLNRLSETDYPGGGNVNTAFGGRSTKTPAFTLNRSYDIDYGSIARTTWELVRRLRHLALSQ